MRCVGAIALLVASAVPLAAPSTGAAPAPTSAVVACPDQQVPPPPPAQTELAAPAPPPLPTPARPVGGPQLGACDLVGPPGVPPVGAAGWVLADLDTGAVLAARAPHARHRPASTLKVLTALVVLRRLDPDAVVEGVPEDLQVDGSKAGIGPGGRYTVRQLLAGLLLNSGNDTAAALARTLGGDAAATSAMAALARELGAADTRPATPSGLDAPGMASSAYDIALLFRVALRDPLFAATIATHSVDFPGYGTFPPFVLSNSSQLLVRYPGALGGKTGFTDAARHTLVGAAQRGGRRLVVALVRGEQQPEPMWKQAAALLDWGFAQPVDAAPVGVLVERPPAPPTSTPPTSAPTSDPPARPAADAPEPPGGAPRLLGPVAAVVAAVVAVVGGAVLALRRARR